MNTNIKSIAEIREIEMDIIRENEQNNRSMDPADIESIANGIVEHGLLQPILVYPDGDKYVILGGHRRYYAFKRALEIMGDPKTTIPCVVHDKPTDRFSEQEILSLGNIHRNKPEELATEIDLNNEIWNSMDDDTRKQYTARLRERYVKQHEGTPAYDADPAGYMGAHFRPRLEYIRLMTGINASNTTMKKYLSKKLEPEEAVGSTEPIVMDTSEGAEESASNGKEKVVSMKDIVRTARKLLGEMRAVEPDDSLIAGQFDMVCDNLDVLIALIEE